MWLKKTHVIVLVPCGSQHFAQWWQRCCELHHGFQCVRCHEQHKRWIPIRSMGCVHTHRGMLAIEGWDNPSRVRSVMKKTRENSQKVRKIS